MKNNSTTSEHILKCVAPIFNKQGYIGTSLSDLIRATGFTKGALYGNFKNKEELAVRAFELNVKLAILPMFIEVEKQKNSIDKLYAITNYHKTYYELVSDIGGCPMLRVGMDAKFINPVLSEKAQKISMKFVDGLTKILNDGIQQNEIIKNLNIIDQAKLIISMIEGGSLLAFTHNDNSYLLNVTNYIENEIIKK